ncbi:hypothetical protein AQS70_00625 [Pseudomonas endophytica]|uniref:Uncharacterized protein n=1 Tax=Pseudomonas endophytica TaxID=1563157 RepID=A0A0Q0Z0N0_9PSED|nr:hypothetical protein AQS70_00625 [Pseudomonas endophytica]
MHRQVFKLKIQFLCLKAASLYELRKIRWLISSTPDICPAQIPPPAKCFAIDYYFKQLSDDNLSAHVEISTDNN